MIHAFSSISLQRFTKKKKFRSLEQGCDQNSNGTKTWSSDTSKRRFPPARRKAISDGEAEEQDKYPLLRRHEENDQEGTALVRSNGSCTEDEVSNGRASSNDSSRMYWMPGSEEWQNLALEICRQQLGHEKMEKRLLKFQNIPNPGVGSKARLNLCVNRIKKAVLSRVPFLQHNNGVSALGYACVLEDPRLPDTDFFTAGRRFRVRLRHSAIRNEDDASSCSREAALKFADQNEDGPLDLIMTTGRIAPANNSQSLCKILQAKRNQDVRYLCTRDPNFYFYLVDSLRRAPSSYFSMHYHSQITYRLLTKNDTSVLVKFRLVSAENPDIESGRLSLEEQREPWTTNRDPSDLRSRDYLRDAFLERLEHGTIRYTLQIQIFQGTIENGNLWNAQCVWDEEEHPWINLMKLSFATPLPPGTTRWTYFNTANRPSCLRLPPAVSCWDYKSYHNALSSMYTIMELKRVPQTQTSAMVPVNGTLANLPAVNRKRKRGAMTIVYHVVVSTKKAKEGEPSIDVYITLTGTTGRSVPQRLYKRLDDILDLSDQDDECYMIQSAPIGDILTVTIDVRHRHLTSDWFLRSINLTDMSSRSQHHFPCHSVVMAKVTLRPGEVRLPMWPIHEVLRQERLLDLREKKHVYMWQAQSGLPGKIWGYGVTDLPATEQLMAEKYANISWDIYFTQEEIMRLYGYAKAPLYNRLVYGRTQQQAIIESAASASGYAARRRQMTPEQRAALRKSAQKKWRKLRLAIKFLQATARIPDGSKGEICKGVNDDADFGKHFTQGSNPTVIEQCKVPPECFPVMEMEAKIIGFTDRGMTLEEEFQAGNMYLVHYPLLKNIPVRRRGIDIRYMTDPLCLLYSKATGDLIPLAIQLSHSPLQGSTDPPAIYTPRSKVDDWLLAKLWVRSADFTYQLASHLLLCHFVIEAVSVATVRSLSSSHPVYKLIKPHFRYILSGNALLRAHVLSRGGNVDRWTSVGSQGLMELVRRMYATFTLDDIDVAHDLKRRNVHKPGKPANYYYADDSQQHWVAVRSYCEAMVKLFYTSDQDVGLDYELQAWIDDLNENGFTSKEGIDRGFPKQFTTLSELIDLTAKIIYTCTVRHAATHCEAMDMYGHEGIVPACMKMPPPTKEGEGKKDLTVKTLPDQNPDQYCITMSYVMAQYKADMHPLGDNTESYLVEPTARAVQEKFCEDLQHIGEMIEFRNKRVETPYEALHPDNIPNTVEPLPFMPHTDPSVQSNAARETLKRTNSNMSAANSNKGTLPRQNSNMSSTNSNTGTLPRQNSRSPQPQANNVENHGTNNRLSVQRTSTRGSLDVPGISALASTVVPTVVPTAAATAAALMAEDQGPAEVGMYRKVMLVTPSQPIMSVNICMQFVRIMTGRGMFVAPSARGLGLSSENTDEGVSSRRGGGERKARSAGMDFTPINAEA